MFLLSNLLTKRFLGQHGLHIYGRKRKKREKKKRHIASPFLLEHIYMTRKEGATLLFSVLNATKREKESLLQVSRVIG